jgi:CCR4-NOT transcription complex subunit 3
LDRECGLIEQEEDFDFDDGLYEDLNLQEEDEYLQDISHNDDLSNLDSSSAVDYTESTTPPVTATAPKTPAKERTPSISLPSSTAKPVPATEEPPSPIIAKKQPSRKSTLDSTKAELPAKTKVESVPVPTAKTSMPAIRYAAAVAGPTTATAPAPAPGASFSGQEVSASPVENKSELPELTPAISEPPREEKELALPAQSPAPVPEPAPRTASTNVSLLPLFKA